MGNGTLRLRSGLSSLERAVDALGGLGFTVNNYLRVSLRHAIGDAEIARRAAHACGRNLKPHAYGFDKDVRVFTVVHVMPLSQELHTITRTRYLRVRAILREADWVLMVMRYDPQAEHMKEVVL